MSKRRIATDSRMKRRVRIAEILLLVLLIPLAGCETNKFVGAAAKGEIATVKTMLAEGADINQRGSFHGETALISAARKGRTETVQLLLDRGADMDATDDSGRTALTEAADNDHCDVIRALLNKGADVNAKGTRYGGTALMMAAHVRRVDAVQLLLQNGADVNATDELGRTALLWVALERPDYACSFRTRKDYFNVIEYIGDHPRDVRRIDRSEMKVVEALLKHGANPNVREGSVKVADEVAFGRTPLYLAAWNGAESVVKILLDRGADVDAKTDGGWTPLMAAAYRSTKQHLQIVKDLLAHGADAQARDKDGDTARRLSGSGDRYDGRDEIQRLLKEAEAAKANTDRFD